MAVSAGTTIVGLKQIRKRLSEPTWVEKPAGSFLSVWRTFAQQDAVENAPEWHGDLKRSIATAQDTSRFPLWARVYSDLDYAEFMEEGTKPHWPPIEAVREWAEEHGIEPYLVARSIAEHGTEPRHFFADAEQAADQHINAWMAAFAANIERAVAAGA